MMADRKTALLLLGSLFIVGCAGRAEQLLRTDYRTMGNDDLLRYYYQVDEEVAKCQARADRTSVGLGTGYGGGGFGLGVGIQQGVGGCDLDALRQRRGEVRFLLNKRGITP
ncbi:MAG: hypothetical protein M0017_03450 [Desulfobacteraceae bacterium]|nr:hypothetical protein [Desulfobacteraceae bacterium]